MDPHTWWCNIETSPKLLKADGATILFSTVEQECRKVGKIKAWGWKVCKIISENIQQILLRYKQVTAPITP